MNYIYVGKMEVTHIKNKLIETGDEISKVSGVQYFNGSI
jgi:hypothetical protein